MNPNNPRVVSLVDQSIIAPPEPEMASVTPNVTTSNVALTEATAVHPHPWPQPGVHQLDHQPGHPLHQLGHPHNLVTDDTLQTIVPNVLEMEDAIR